MKTEENNTVAGVLAILALISLIPAWIYSGHILTILWGWFITPTFGLAAPSVATMMGISLFISLLRAKNVYYTDDRSTEKQMQSALVYMWVLPTICYILGYILVRYI